MEEQVKDSKIHNGYRKNKRTVKSIFTKKKLDSAKFNTIIHLDIFIVYN